MSQNGGHAIRRGLLEMGVPPADWPAELHEPPNLYPTWWEMARAAFHDLSTERVSVFGIGPIPWRAIVEWCRFNNVVGATARTLVLVVRRMDAAYLRIEAQRAKDKEPARG